MPQCPHCSSEIPEEALFCEACGKRVAGEPITGSDAPSASPALSEADTLSDAPPVPTAVSEPPPVAADSVASAPVTEARVEEAPAPVHRRAVQETGCALRLEINAARIYVEGYAGSVEVRLVNNGQEVIDKASVYVDCGYVVDTGYRVIKGILPRATSRVVHIQCRFDAGQLVVGFTVTTEAAGIRRVFRGDSEILVLPKVETPQQMLVNIQDAVRIDGEKGAMGGSINVPINVSRDVAAGGIKDVQTLLRELYKVTARWCEVPLYLAEEVPLAEAAAQVSEKTLSRRAAENDRLRLDIATPGMTKRVLLVAKPEVRFGRSRQANDIALVVLPRNIANDRQSRMVTAERHFTLALEDSGLELMDASTNGTIVNGRRLHGECTSIPAKPVEISPGGAFNLRLTPLAFKSGFAPDAYKCFVRGRLFHLAAATGLAAVRIERVDNFPDEMYVLLYAGATVGASGAAGIPVPGAGLALHHILILHLGDGFYVENVSGAAAALNDRAFLAEQIEPIAPGDRIMAGGVTLEVGRYEHLRPKG